jgi:hypothetical protein
LLLDLHEFKVVGKRRICEMTKRLKFLGLAVLALVLPLFASSAMAAEARHPGEAMKSLSGGTAMPTMLLGKANLQPEKIVVARRWRRGRGVGAAIVGGVIAGALIAGAARAHDEERYYYRRRHANRCDRWLWQCDHGNGRSCRKFYRYCE